MRKIIFIIIVIGMFTANSCNVTNVVPLDALPSSTIFNDSTNIELAVVGVYHSTQSQLYGYNDLNDPRGYPFGAAHVEQGEMRGEDLVNAQGFFQIVYDNNQTASSPNCVNLWAALFEVVNQANTVINGLRGTKAISASRVNSFIGEMRYLRAMAYHDFLVFFARPYGDNPTTNLGVPYRTNPTTPLNVDSANARPRNSVADCYTAIIADLDFAEANLPATNNVNSVTRATKGAAIALKTRVYLHQNNWTKVITEAAKLVSSPSAPTSPIGGYALNTTPDGAFTNFSTPESIFSIEYSTINQASVNGGLGSAFLPPNLGGRGLIGVSPNLYNSTFWTATDTRRSTYIVLGTLSGKNAYFVYKYKDPITNTDFEPVIRYSEVLLNYSEALARMGDLANSLSLLNAVRNRAVNINDRYTSSSFATGNDQIQAILNERRIEFIGEGRRWPDIHRLSTDATFSPLPNGGIPSKLLFADYSSASFDAASGLSIFGSVDSIPYSDHRFLYPVSYLEIANNPIVIQNPGY